MKEKYLEIKKNFYKKYSEEELKDQLNKFINQELDLSEINDKGKAYTKIINHFFEEEIYSGTSRRTKNKTPNEVLNDEETLDKIYDFIKTKPNFYTGNDVNNLKTFFRNAGKYAIKISNFSPNAARKIYEKYCSKQNANILDYSCGFGSRMLGCLSSKYNYNYYGIEPNTKVFKKLIELAEFINKVKKCNYKLFCQGSEDFIPELEGKIDLAFSSPPYFDMEIYSKETTQSIIRYPKYEDWLKFYVTNTIKNIKKYLKSNGLFILNIKNLTEGKAEPLLDDWIKIAKQEGFYMTEILDMKHQGSKSALGKYKVENGFTNYQAFKEPLVIFKKQKEKYVELKGICKKCLRL